MSLSQKIISFLNNLHPEFVVPEGISVMNPYKENPEVMQIASAFYDKFYGDNKKRKLILGINPGRLGAGSTGIPFTDTKRLQSHCGIACSSIHTHEPSSVFVYDVIDAYGGVKKFYNHFYITSICPLGFVKRNAAGKEVNFNYYDDKNLMQNIKPFALKKIREQINWGLNTDVAYCLGAGKNYDFIAGLNEEHKLFKKLIALDHPRYIMQYKSKAKEDYITKYLSLL